MTNYLVLLCCTILLCSSAFATSGSSASLRISASNHGGKSNVDIHSEGSAVGRDATAAIIANAAASTYNSEAAITHTGLANSHRGRTDVVSNTEGHTLGGGKIHGSTFLEALNRHSESSLDTKTVAESKHDGGSIVTSDAGVTSDIHGSDGHISNTGTSVGRSQGASTARISGLNRRGNLDANQHTAFSSGRRGASIVEAGITSNFHRQFGTSFNTALKGNTEGDGAVIAGSEGAAIDKSGASAAKLALDVQSAARRRFGLGGPSRSRGFIYLGTNGGLRSSKADAEAEAEVQEEGTAAVTASGGTLTAGGDDSFTEAKLAINADRPQRQNRPHNNRRRNYRRRNDGRRYQRRY